MPKIGLKKISYQTDHLSHLETRGVHGYVTGVEEEGMGEIENVLLWFLTSKQVWYLLYLVDKILMRHDTDKRISIDTKVCHGQACIKGTRIPVHQIIRMLANGDTIEELIEESNLLGKVGGKIMSGIGAV